MLRLKSGCHRQGTYETSTLRTLPEQATILITEYGHNRLVQEGLELEALGGCRNN